MDIQSLYSEYRRWVNEKPGRFRTVNSFRPSGAGSCSTSTATLNATTTTTATVASQTGQPQPGPSSLHSRSTTQPDPEIREFHRNEDTFNYRRFSKYASKQRDASKPENSDTLSNYESVYKQDFRGLWGPPAMSARPPDHLKVSTCRFAPTTEYQDQFRAWQVPPSYQRQATSSRPTQRMDLQTSYVKDFKDLQGDLTAWLPDNLWVSGSSPTEYQNERLVPPPQRYRPEYVCPMGKMDFSTSYGQDFKAQEGSMRFLIVPRDHIGMPQGAIQGKTTYTSDFSPKSAGAL